jgi:hypothetical protein
VWGDETALRRGGSDAARARLPAAVAACAPAPEGAALLAAALAAQHVASTRAAAASEAALLIELLRRGGSAGSGTSAGDAPGSAGAERCDASAAFVVALAAGADGAAHLAVGDEASWTGRKGARSGASAAAVAASRAAVGPTAGFAAGAPSAPPAARAALFDSAGALLSAITASLEEGVALTAEGKPVAEGAALAAALRVALQCLRTRAALLPMPREDSARARFLALLSRIVMHALTAAPGEGAGAAVDGAAVDGAASLALEALEAARAAVPPAALLGATAPPLLDALERALPNLHAVMGSLAPLAIRALVLLALTAEAAEAPTSEDAPLVGAAARVWLVLTHAAPPAPSGSANAAALTGNNVRATALALAGRLLGALGARADAAAPSALDGYMGAHALASPPRAAPGTATLDSLLHTLATSGTGAARAAALACIRALLAAPRVDGGAAAHWRAAFLALADEALAALAEPDVAAALLAAGSRSLAAPPPREAMASDAAAPAAAAPAPAPPAPPAPAARRRARGALARLRALLIIVGGMPPANPAIAVGTRVATTRARAAEHVLGGASPHGGGAARGDAPPRALCAAHCGAVTESAPPSRGVDNGERYIPVFGTVIALLRARAGARAGVRGEPSALALVALDGPCTCPSASPSDAPFSEDAFAEAIADAAALNFAGVVRDGEAALGAEASAWRRAARATGAAASGGRNLRGPPLVALPLEALTPVALPSLCAEMAEKDSEGRGGATAPPFARAVTERLLAALEVLTTPVPRAALAPGVPATLTLMGEASLTPTPVEKSRGLSEDAPMARLAAARAAALRDAACALAAAPPAVLVSAARALERAAPPSSAPSSLTSILPRVLSRLLAIGAAAILPPAFVTLPDALAYSRLLDAHLAHPLTGHLGSAMTEGGCALVRRLPRSRVRAAARVGASGAAPAPSGAAAARAAAVISRGDVADELADDPLFEDQER